jgi:hypothetical protein
MGEIEKFSIIMLVLAGLFLNLMLEITGIKMLERIDNRTIECTKKTEYRKG